MTADLIWAPNPKKFNFETPLIDLNINMKELKLKVTKLQYKDFAQSLHSVNQMQLASSATTRVTSSSSCFFASNFKF